MRGIRIRWLLPALALVTACSSGGSDVSTAPATTTTTAAATVSTTAPTTITVAPPSTSRVTSSGRPELAPPIIGAAQELIAGPTGLTVTFADGTRTTMLDGSVGFAAVTTTREIVVQRAAGGAIETYDLIDHTTAPVMAASTGLVLHDVARIDGQPWVLVSRPVDGLTAIVRRSVRSGVEREVTRTPPGATVRTLTMNGEHIAGIVEHGGATAPLFVSLDGEALAPLPADCATAPCAAWQCTPLTDPCRPMLAVGATPTGGRTYVFVERRGGQQVVTAVEEATDSSSRLRGWVPLPDGVIVRKISMLHDGRVSVDTWSDVTRTAPGRSVIVGLEPGRVTVMPSAGTVTSAVRLDPTMWNGDGRPRRPQQHCSSGRFDAPASVGASADVDGDGAVDIVRFHGPPSSPTLQVELSGGGWYTAPLVVETATILAMVDLDHDGSTEMLLSREGNTAAAGVILDVRTCQPRVVTVAGGDGSAAFTYRYAGNGRGCAPACHPVLVCVDEGSGTTLHVSDATRVDPQPGQPAGAEPPGLRDDLLYDWTLQRWRYEDGTMRLADDAAGRSTYAALPVPKRQGVEC